MSCWTHIVATFDVDTYTKTKDTVKYVETLLKDAPKITGSERNVDIFVNLLSGHNVYTSCDCDRCKYKDTIIHHEDGGFICKSEENFKCPDGSYQTRVVITVIGDLRDRLKERTQAEYKAFKKYLMNTCDFEIRNSSVKIRGW